MNLTEIGTGQLSLISKLPPETKVLTVDCSILIFFTSSISLAFFSCVYLPVFIAGIKRESVCLDLLCVLCHRDNVKRALMQYQRKCIVREGFAQKSEVRWRSSY